MAGPAVLDDGTGAGCFCDRAAFSAVRWLAAALFPLPGVRVGGGTRAGGGLALAVGPAVRAGGYDKPSGRLVAVHGWADGVVTPISTCLLQRLRGPQQPGAPL